MIIPALDSAETLPAALDSIAAQDYPNIVEVVVAAGDAATAAVARGRGVVVVDNPSGRTPVGLNRALAATTGEVIVRCDAQSELSPGYVSRAVQTLEETGADNVGGMQIPVGSTFKQKAIAAAMASSLGAGDARYRVGGEAGPAETVYLGVYRRATLERLGGFDESFLRTQDYELNHRINQSGGIVWFDPGLETRYRPRKTLRSLARQYHDYGRAKRLFARKHRGGLRPRQMAPPVLVVVLAVSLLGAVFEPRLLVVPAAYLGLLIVGGLLTIPRAGAAALLVPIALAVMHLSWGLGFLRETSVPVEHGGPGPDETRADLGSPGAS